MFGKALPRMPRLPLMAGLALLALAGPAQAQRDPAYAAARAAGQVGEKKDGYLGFVTSPGSDLRGLVDEINIKRRALYSQKAQAANATVEEYAFTSGCQLILQTVAGEKYEGPSGGWLTRSSTPPQRDARCP